MEFGILRLQCCLPKLTTIHQDKLSSGQSHSPAEPNFPPPEVELSCRGGRMLSQHFDCQLACDKSYDVMAVARHDVMSRSIDE